MVGILVLPLLKPLVVDYFGKFYPRIRRFSSHFLSTLQFHSRSNDQGLLQALDLVREIHTGARRKLPDTAPTEFIPDTWRSYVIDAEGFNRRYYELAALWILRQQLRSGDIYLSHSRRFSTLESYFMSKEEWQKQRQETVTLLGTPIDATVRLAEREAELLRLIGQNETELPILEHTTDTAGYTELIFALFDLLGYSSRLAFMIWLTRNCIAPVRSS